MNGDKVSAMSKKLIGYWMRDLRDTDLPLPHELVGDIPELVKQAVCVYLTSGRLFEEYRGLSWCRFYCGVTHKEMGFREFTDGVWVWPEGLVHYVQTHNVVLPEEFIATATSGRATPESDHDSLTLDFWLLWTAKRQNPSIRRQLAEALAAARTAEPEFVDRIVEEVRQRQGEGHEQCNFEGCSQPALSHRRLCARHVILNYELQWRTAPLYQLPRQY